MQPRPWSHQALSQPEPLLSAKALYIPSLTPSACGTSAKDCPLEGQEGCPQCCWEQPGTLFTGWVSGELSAPVHTCRPPCLGSIHKHIPAADAPWTGQGAAGWTLGTLFSSRADQASRPLVRMLSLWLEVSGCCCNVNSQINWDWLCIGIIEVAEKFFHANTSARHQRERNQNPGAEESQKLENLESDLKFMAVWVLCTTYLQD